MAESIDAALVTVTVTVTYDPRNPPHWVQPLLDAFRAGVAVSGSIVPGVLEPITKENEHADHPR
jgi:hypothetical protein